MWGQRLKVHDGMLVNEEVRRRGRRFVIIAAGYFHALGLLDDGQVIGWGTDASGQVSGATASLEASGGSRYLAISAGLDISMGLTDNGIIVFWGSDTYIKERMVKPPSGRKFVC